MTPTETMRRARELFSQHNVARLAGRGLCTLCHETWPSTEGERHTPDCIISQLDALALAATPDNVAAMRAALEKIAAAEPIGCVGIGTDMFGREITDPTYSNEIIEVARAALNATGDDNDSYVTNCEIFARPGDPPIFTIIDGTIVVRLNGYRITPLPTPPAEGGRDE